MLNQAIGSLAIIASSLLSPELLADGKILFVGSYNEGDAWSDGVCDGVKKTVGEKAELRILHLDSRRRSSEEEISAAAKAAAETIEQWKPGVVIVSDDIAVKRFLVPYLKDKETPCVFCGVNWDASVYGLPCKNTTGIIEVSLIAPLMEKLRTLSPGQRIGFLGAINETNVKEAAWTARKLNCELKTSFAKSMREWEESYLKFQDSADILILCNSSGIEGWDEIKAKDFALSNTKIPTGSSLEFMKGVALITFAKSAQEQGEWSGAAALRLLNGAKPSEIPVAENKRTVIFINITLAEKMGVRFPIDLIRNSKVVR